MPVSADGKRWTIDDAEKAQIPAWNERWKSPILSTEEIDFDRAAEAVRGMYAAANLAEPIVVRCLSPMQGAIVWAWASMYWSASTRDATYAATYAATDAATRDATDAATRDATCDATRDATDAATRDATCDATYAATYAATRDATDAATRDATYAMIDAATHQTEPLMFHAARNIVLRKLQKNAYGNAEAKAIKLLRSWFSARNGGNEWASWCCYLSFVRDVVGWKHESHKNYAHYENAAIYGGVRYMHPKFCLICDRPTERHTRILTSGEHQLHRENGPAIRWKCGTAAWYLEGQKTTEQVVMRPGSLTPDDVHATTDEELRSLMLERYPWERYLGDIGAKCIDEGANDIEGTYEALFDAPKVNQRRLVATCATGHIVSLGVPAETKTITEARNYLNPFGSTTRIVART